MIKRILTIDDDPTLLEVYRDIFVPKKSQTQKGLAQLGAMFDDVEIGKEDEADFEVTSADSGEEGVKTFFEAYQAGTPFDMCVVDMRMPRGIDGLETATQIRKIDQNASILIVTAFTDKTPEEIRASLKWNVYFLRKPFDQSELYQIVFSLSQNSQNMRSLEKINDELEIRIKEEVAKNRDKDVILMRQSKLVASSELLSNIAHHWRQPLNAVAINIQNIEVSHICGDLTTEELSTMVKNSMGELKYLSSVIDKFSDLFKTKKEITRFSVGKILNDSFMIAYPSMKESHINISTSFTDDFFAMGVEEDFKQVVRDLINNAKDAIINKKIENGSIMLSLKKDGENFSFCVQDNAGGVDEGIMDKIFEPYFTTKHKAQGVGLGLFVAKTIIEQEMDGVLNVTNAGGGARFCVTIPIA
jgi:signal transduction histidine kinase